MHGKFIKETTEKVDKEKLWQWLSRGDYQIYFFLSIQIIKIFLKYTTTQCTILIVKGQISSSTDLYIY